MVICLVLGLESVIRNTDVWVQLSALVDLRLVVVLRLRLLQRVVVMVK